MINNVQLGYACINMTLREQDVYTSRTFSSKNFTLDRASELAIKNLADLLTILNWNVQQGFKVFRIASGLFPRWEKYRVPNLPAYLTIQSLLSAIGQFIKQNELRVSFHPDHFVKLAALDPLIRSSSMQELENHDMVFETMGINSSYNSKINIHVGGAYDDKAETAKRFCQNFLALSPSLRGRLTVENDDKGALFSVKDLYEGLYKEIGIPLVFDMHHHQFNTGGLSIQEAFELAYSTWPKGIIPTFHYSESRDVGKAAHSDYIAADHFETYGKDLCVIVEAKAKELAVLKYLEKQKVIA